MPIKGKADLRTIRRIRRIADARKAIPSEKTLAEELGYSVATIRAIGARRLYKNVPEPKRRSKQRPAPEAAQ